MKKSKNILEIIPIKNPNVSWEIKDKKVFLTKHRTHTFDFIMHKIFKTPLQTHTELEELGSFIWKQCDGIQNIYDISENLKSHFGEKAHPVLGRLFVYIKTLSDNGFIKI